MALNDSDVKQLAKLARLEMMEAEMVNIKQQLNDFFTFVEQMQEVDTSQIEPLSHPSAFVNKTGLRLRPDEVTETNQRDAFQQNAPAVENGLYLVPKVIE